MQRVNEGEILREKRIAKGLTQGKVAEMAGIALRQYQRFENNERLFIMCSARIFLGICKALELDPYILYNIYKETRV